MRVYKIVPPVDRFRTKYVVDPASGCWLWRRIATNRYGRFWDGTRVVSAHRWSYEWFVGPIPEGLQIDHVRARGCKSRRCVNLAHLEPVTPKENTMRGDSPTRVNADKGVCSQGHPYDAANTYALNGHRLCRLCRRVRNRSDAARRSAARGERTHCLHGHPRTEQNSYIAKDGGRRCLPCRRENSARHRIKKGARG